MALGVRPRGKIPAKKVTEAVFHPPLLQETRDASCSRTSHTGLGREPFRTSSRITRTSGPQQGESPKLHRLRQVVLYVMERGEGWCAAVGSNTQAAELIGIDLRKRGKYADLGTAHRVLERGSLRLGNLVPATAARHPAHLHCAGGAPKRRTYVTSSTHLRPHN